MASEEGSLRLRFDASTHPDPAKRIEGWRDAFAASVDVSFAPGEIADFSAGADFCRLGPALLADTRYTDHTVVRDRRTIARTGGEQIILDVFTEGGITGQLDGRPCKAKAGDCFVMDMRGTFRLHLLEGRFIGFIMPRNLFEEASAGSTMMHGRVLPAGTPNANVLGAMLTCLADAAPRMAPAAAEAIGRAVITLVAACLCEADVSARQATVRATRPSSPRRSDPSLVRLRRHIERHAADPAYDPDMLARAFGLSRSALYRLFRPHGGVADAIRRRRADLAFRALTSEERGRRPLSEIARASGFPDARTLKRAMRTIFDATPDDLRESRFDAVPGTGDAGLEIGALFDNLPR